MIKVMEKSSEFFKKPGEVTGETEGLAQTSKISDPGIQGQ